MPEGICSRCAHPNGEASNYCSSCGFDLHRSLEEVTTELAAIDISSLEAVEGSESASFIIKRGHRAGSRYALAPGLTAIGRHPESAIFLDDVTVSRRHAEVRFDAGLTTINDAGSLNGTYVNRERIDSAPLRSGDEVQIGKFKLVFLAENS